MGCVKRVGNHNKFQVQAMKNNQRSGGGTWILHELILYCLTALACSLFCYHPYWLPHVCGFIQKLPFFWSCLFSTKCLFLVANAIVLYLFGESVFLGSSPSSSSSDPASDYYKEYVERTRKAGASSTSVSVSNINEMGGRSEVKEPITKEVVAATEIKAEEEVVVKRDVDVHGDDEEEKLERDDEGRKEDAAEILPAEELNKRVEEFIARVNKQRRLEARSLVVSCRAS